MADKIVILEDSEGNNIYPISRGLATNSVDTNAIQNGAVTSAKIDWPTFSTSLTLGPNVTGSATATLFGNLVCIQMINIAGISSSDTIICSIPDSLRPTAQFSAMRAVGLQNGGSWKEFNLILVSQSGNGRIVANGAPGAMNAGNFVFWYPLV